MKIKTVKIFAAAAIAAGLIMGTGAGAYAAEKPAKGVQRETGDSLRAEEEEETGDSSEAAYIYGEWNNNGDSLLFMPDGYVYKKSGVTATDWERYIAYEISGDQITFDLDSMTEELQMPEGQTDPALSAVLQDAGMAAGEALGDRITEKDYYLEAGTDKILAATSSYTDHSDPLSPAAVENISYVYKKRDMADYLLLLLGDKTWKLEENVLTIEIGNQGLFYEMDLSLNQGERVGSVTVKADGTITFNWDGGDAVDYTYVTADADSFTVSAAENTYVFTSKEEAAQEASGE